MTDYPTVLTRRYPDALWELSGDDYANLVWHGPGDPPSQAELDGLWPTVAHELAVEDVQRQRREAYRLEADPLYFEWQAGEGTEAAWLAARAAIRARYPMPEA